MAEQSETSQATAKASLQRLRDLLAAGLVLWVVGLGLSLLAYLVGRGEAGPDAGGVVLLRVGGALAGLIGSPFLFVGLIGFAVKYGNEASNR